MDMFLWLAAGHFIGDFDFQSVWMSEAKRNSLEVMFYHAATYSLTIMTVVAIGGFRFPPEITGLFFISHFLIDPLKARWGIIKHIWLDQILHLSVILAVISMFQ